MNKRQLLVGTALPLLALVPGGLALARDATATAPFVVAQAVPGEPPGRAGGPGTGEERPRRGQGAGQGAGEERGERPRSPQQGAGEQAPRGRGPQGAPAAGPARGAEPAARPAASETAPAQPARPAASERSPAPAAPDAGETPRQRPDRAERPDRGERPGRAGQEPTSGAPPAGAPARAGTPTTTQPPAATTQPGAAPAGTPAVRQGESERPRPRSQETAPGTPPSAPARAGTPASTPQTPAASTQPGTAPVQGAPAVRQGESERPRPRGQETAPGTPPAGTPARAGAPAPTTQPPATTTTQPAAPPAGAAPGRAGAPPAATATQPAAPPVPGAPAVTTRQGEPDRFQPRMEERFAPGLATGDRRNARVDDLRAVRRERVEDGGRRVIIEESDRRIIREGNRTVIIHDETERMRRSYSGADVRTERRGAEEVTIVRRPNGVEIITVQDEYGNVIRRVRREPDRREVVLFEDVGRGRPRGAFVTEVVELPPPVIRIPREKYVVEVERASPEELYEAFTAPPVERIDRRYSLEEVRRSQSLRERVRRVDVDTVTFDLGSWTLPSDEVGALTGVANAILRAVERNPAEVFLVEGHTDAVGNDVDNLSLSDRRAETVATILSERFQVPAENLTTQGYGEQYLKINTQSAERQNRRVTIRRITPLLQNEASAGTR